ncbi:Protein WVD2-like 7 [Linum perenne]
MATEAEAAVSCNGGENWSCPKLHRDGEESQGQAVCISKLVDHRSISFGRYEAENLAWEKFSVFSPNRRKEEVEKSTAPGLVAQKKAFFEEYFKSFRAMKGLFKGQKLGETAGSLQSGQEKGNGIGTVRETKSRSFSQSPNTKDVNRLEQRKKKQNPAKGSVSSATSILKPGSKIKNNDVKRPGGLLKPSVTKTVPKKPVKEVKPAKPSVNGTSLNHAQSNRKLGEVRNAVRDVQAKTARANMVSSPKTKKSLEKPSTTTKVAAKKLPVPTQISKTIASTGHTRGSNLTNRNCNEVGKKSLSSSSGPSKQKISEPGNQKPKFMPTKLPVSTASKTGAKSIKSARGEKPEKKTTAMDARIGRDPKPAPSKVTDIRTTSSNASTARKIPSSRSGLTNELKDPKERVPKRR